MSDVTDRLDAALRDRYRIEREIGEGGMATVYLADDLKHHRKVALKVLRPELAAVVGAERFLAEIETTAKLQHPHILPLHDSGEADGSPFFVMPLVEGESLRERLDRERQLPVEEAVEIASKVAAALDYAHRHGVIHRDIKPANILLHDGEPVVSDFGIALAVSAGGGDRITETGLSLGTPHYMSPEQATGDQSVGPPTDIWALGCVLYEMLVGEPPYTGGTPQSILGKIITADVPSVSDERRTVPANVEATVAKALEKLPADRFTDAQTFVKALGDHGFRHGTDARVGRDSYALTRWKLIAALAVAIAAALAVFQLSNVAIQSSSAPAAQRHRVVLGSGIEAIPRIVSDRLALAPDGSGILFGDTAGMEVDGSPHYQGPRSYWWKPHDQAEAVRLPNMDNAMSPVFSPDGQWVAYAVRGQIRKKPLRGGASVLLADSPGTLVPALTWLTDGTILFGSQVGRGGLERISEDGETRAVVSGTERMGSPRYASGLLGGGGALVTSVPPCTSTPCQARLFLVDLERDTVEALANDVLRAWHAPGERVVYVDGRGAVFAARLDVEGLQLGPPVPLFDGVVVRGTAQMAQMEVGRDGTLLYLTGEGTTPGYLPVWVDRDGSSRPIDPDWIVYGGEPGLSLALSPDDTRLALSSLHMEERSLNLWVKDLDTGPLSRLTDGTRAGARRPRWSPDGEFLTFVGGGIRRARSDGTGETATVLDPPLRVEALFSPDGEWLIYREGSTSGNTDPDIFALEVGADTVGRPLVATEHVEWNPSLSPDGRWLAYTSDETGEQEVYVRPFPEVESAKWQVSNAGGFNPVWSDSGDELFYRNGEHELVSVEVTSDRAFATGEPETLFGLDGYFTSDGHPMYDVASDGRRFVMLKAAATSRGQTANVGSLVLVQNFFEELKEPVPN